MSRCCFTDISPCSSQPRGNLARQLSNLVRGGAVVARAVIIPIRSASPCSKFAAKAWAGNQSRYRRAALEALHDLTGETCIWEVLPRENEVILSRLKWKAVRLCAMYSQNRAMHRQSIATGVGIGWPVQALPDAELSRRRSPSIRFHRFTGSTLSPRSTLLSEH